MNLSDREDLRGLAETLSLVDREGHLHLARHLGHGLVQLPLLEALLRGLRLGP